HAIYIPHMIESFDYYINSVVPVREGGKQIVDMSGPRYHRLIGYGDIPFLFPSQTEPYETTREYFEFAGLTEGQTVLDIGAYWGVTSIIFAQLFGPRGQVFAFEADERNCECAKVYRELAELRSSASALRDLGAKMIIEPHWVEGKLVTGALCDLLKSAGYAVRVRDKTAGSEALIEAVPV